jgi:hypothetical protein
MRAGSALPLKHVWMMEHRPPTRWSVGFIRLEHVRGTYYRRRYWYFLTTGQVAARLPHTITFAWRHRAVYEALFAALSEIYVLRYPKKKESP